MQNIDPPGIRVAITLTLAQWLQLQSLGRSQNVSFIVPAGTTVTDEDNTIGPLAGDSAVLLASIQFDAVTSGQVGYSLHLDNGGEVAGFAVNGVPAPIDAIASGHVRYEIENASAQDTVCNIAFISLSMANLSTVQAILSPISTQFGNVFAAR